MMTLKHTIFHQVPKCSWTICMKIKRLNISITQCYAAIAIMLAPKYGDFATQPFSPTPLYAPPLSTHDIFVSGDYTYPYPPTCIANHKNNVWWAYREEHYCRWWTKSTPVYSTVFKFCSMIKAYIRRSSCVFCVYLNIRCNIHSLALESTISHNSVCFCIE